MYSRSRVLVPSPTYSDPMPDYALLRSSEQHGWNGILVHQYRLAPQLERVPAPETTTHILYIVVRGFGAHETVLDGRATHARPTPGNLALLPASAPAAHSWNASFEVAPLYLAPTLVTAAAAEIDRSDPDRVALCPHLSFRDPLIEQLGRSFVG